MCPFTPGRSNTAKIHAHCSTHTNHRNMLHPSMICFHRNSCLCCSSARPHSRDTGFMQGWTRDRSTTRIPPIRSCRPSENFACAHSCHAWLVSLYGRASQELKLDAFSSWQDMYQVSGALFVFIVICVCRPSSASSVNRRMLQLTNLKALVSGQCYAYM